MFKKLSNLVPNTFMTLIAGIGVIGLITLFGTLYHYFSNPLAYTTPIQGILLGSIPTLVLGGIWVTAFFIKKHFTQKTEIEPESEPKNLEQPELTEEPKAKPDVDPEPTLTEQNHLENQAEVEPKNLESEKKLDENPEKELNLNLEPKGVEFEFVSKPSSEEVSPEEPEEPKKHEQQEIVLPEKTQIEKEMQQLEFMKVRENLRKVHSANLAQSAVKPEPKSILKSTEEMDSSSSESSAKKVQSADPIANVMNIRLLPEKDQPVEVEFAAVTHHEDKKDESVETVPLKVEFTAVTHQEDKKDESVEAAPVKVKLEPAEEQPVVYHPQHDAQRAQTRQRRAPQVNLQRNHDQANVLPEGTTRTRNKVDRFSGSGRR